MNENEKTAETEKLFKAVEIAEEKIEKCFAELQDSLQKAFACECEKPLLTEKEHNYLSSIIKPFRDKVRFIKLPSYNHLNLTYTCIRMYDNCGVEIVRLPNFKIGKMYNSMELDRKYTLEELGL